MMKFDLPKDQSSIIKVIGVGGGGSNAVNHMYSQGIKGVDFIVCNTDQQALDMSPVPVKIQLGSSLTEGRGAGSIPEVGRNAALENIEDIKGILEKNTRMAFVTAGMGGGTGTGAAPIIAKTGRDLEILTVGIVTIPFSFEGRKRRKQAEEGLAAMRESVDTLLVINNDRLREMYGNLTLMNAFQKADDILSTAARGIAEVITVTGKVNVDFEDVKTVMKDSGVAIMGSARAEGEDRAMRAIEQALASPLLNDSKIIGAKYVLLNITYGEKEVLMDEITDITDYIQDEAGDTADVIWGHGYDEGLGESLSVTIIATGFNINPDTGLDMERGGKKKYISLEDNMPTMITEPISSPVQNTGSRFASDEYSMEPVLKSGEVFTNPNEPYLKEAEEEKSDVYFQERNVEPQIEEPKFVEKPIVQPQVVEAQEPQVEEKPVETTSHISEEEIRRRIEEEVRREYEQRRIVRNQTVAETPVAETPATQIELEVDYPGENKEHQEPEEVSHQSSMRFEESISEDEIVDDHVESEPEQPQVTFRESGSVEKEQYPPVYFRPENGKDNEVKPKAQTVESPNDVKRYYLEDEGEDIEVTNRASSFQDQASVEEQQKRTVERISRLKEMSMRFKSHSSLSELENEPAYKRRNVQLEIPSHSSESNVSKYTLSEEEDEHGNRRVQIRPNNSFLHDNVD